MIYEKRMILYEKKVNLILAVIFGSSLPFDFIVSYFGIFPNYTLFSATVVLEALGVFLIYKKYSPKLIKVLYSALLSFQIVYCMLLFPNMTLLVALGGICLLGLYFDKIIILVSSAGAWGLILYFQYFVHPLDTKSLIFGSMLVFFSSVAVFFKR